MRNLGVVVVFSALLLSVPSAWAQRNQRGGGDPGGGTFLLGQKSVQSELGLSDEQVGKVEAFLNKQRASFAELRNLSREERAARFQENRRAAREAVASILNGEQRARLDQVELQVRGPEAFEDPEVAGKLGLSDEQKTRIGELRSKVRDEMRGLFQGENREAAREKIATLRAGLREKLMGVLDAEQQGKWKELIGKPFDGEIQRPFGRGEGGRRRNRGDGPAGDDARLDRLPTPVRLTSARDDDANSVDAKHDDAKAADATGADKAKGDEKQRAKKKGRPAHQARAKHPRADWSHPKHHDRVGKSGARGPRHPRDVAWHHVARSFGSRDGAAWAFARHGRRGPPMAHFGRSTGRSRPWGSPPAVRRPGGPAGYWVFVPYEPARETSERAFAARTRFDDDRPDFHAARGSHGNHPRAPFHPAAHRGHRGKLHMAGHPHARHPSHARPDDAANRDEAKKPKAKRPRDAAGDNERPKSRDGEDRG